MKNEAIVVAKTELRNYDIPCEVSNTGKGHYRVQFQIKGKTYNTFISKSPSDRRELQNTRGNIRRMLRDAGVLR